MKVYEYLSYLKTVAELKFSEVIFYKTTIDKDGNDETFYDHPFKLTSSSDDFYWYLNQEIPFECEPYFIPDDEFIKSYKNRLELSTDDNKDNKYICIYLDDLY